MRIGTTPWVILNSRRVVTELLEKRAAIYSTRPVLPMAHGLASAGKRILVMPYGDLWRRERKIMHQILNNTKRRIYVKTSNLVLSYMSIYIDPIFGTNLIFDTRIPCL